jgi:membrane-associated phospholipid phosphatase
MLMSFRILKPLDLIVFSYLLLSWILFFLIDGGSDQIVRATMFRLIVVAIMTIIIVYRRKRILNFLRIFFPFILIAYLYSETDILNNLILGEDLDKQAIALEEFLFGMQPALLFSRRVPYSWFSELMFMGYFSYYLLVIGIPVYIYQKVDLKKGEQFAFIIITSFLIYYLIFIILPVAGPQYYFGSNELSVPKGYLFEPAIRLIQSLGERPTAAFPSSHVSICLMLVWGCRKYAIHLLRLILPIAFIMILSTVYIGAHYAIDVIAAFILTPALYLISSKLYLFLSTRISLRAK